MFKWMDVGYTYSQLIQGPQFKISFALFSDTVSRNFNMLSQEKLSVTTPLA